MQALRDELIDVISKFYVGDIVNVLNDTGLDEIFFIDDGDLEYMRDECEYYADVDFSEVDDTDRFFAIDGSRGNRKAHSFDWLDDESYEKLVDYMLRYNDPLGFCDVESFLRSMY